MASAHPVFDLADKFVTEYAAIDPVEATYMGVTGHDHEWGDQGPDGVAARLDLLRSTARALDDLPPASAPFDVLAVRSLRQLVDSGIEAIEHDDPLRDLAHMSSSIPTFREVLEAQDTSSPAAREALLERLTSLPDAMDGWVERMRVGLDRGVVVAARQVTSVIDQLRAGVAAQGSYPQLVEALVADDPSLASAAGASLRAIEAASERTARFLELEYAPHATLEDGVGPERHGRHARDMLGADLDPEEASRWGWAELRRLLARAEASAAAIDPDANLAGVLEQLRTDPAYAAPTPEAFRELMAERQRVALDSLAGEHFDVPQAIREVEVKLTPPGGSIGAYYVGPSEDFSRPGSIWWSLGDRHRVPLYEEVSTAYHEGFPGHHLQIGIQVSLADQLSRAHRLLCWYPGYGEGWALYAETFMDELGMLEEPQYELGYLTGSILRAIRVVMDIGLHLGWRIPDDAPFHPGEPWSFDLAVDVLHHVAGLPLDYARSEVTRYLGWPAQAVTYALGQRTILELREERRARDGAGFDLRTFHADVLGSGPVGLDHLRELVLA